MDLKMKGGRIVIDGREFTGRNISIDGSGRVIVDGVQQDGSLVGPVSVQIFGDVETLSTSGDVTVSGSCGNAKTISGDIQAGDVSGSVQTVSGDVTCRNVGGGVKTISGDIRHA